MNRKIVKDGLIIFFLALLVRVGYAFLFVEPEYLFTEDQTLYIKLAQQFPDSGFLGLTPERMPGYPLFIASIYSIFGEVMWNVILIQILLDSISCIMIATIAHLLFDKGFWIAGVLSSINLNMVILSSTFLPDTLFLFLFILFLFSFSQYLQNKNIRWFFLLTLFISLATLVRPSSYYLLPILLIGLVGWRLWERDTVIKISKLVALYLLVVGTLLGSIHQRNYQQYGSIALASNTGSHLLNWVVPATYQYSGQGSYQEGQKLAREKLAFVLQNDHLERLPSNPFASSSYQANVGKELLFEFGFMNILKAWVVGSTINLLAPSVAYAPALRAMEHPSFYETEGSGIVDKLLQYIKNSSGLLYLSILAVGTIISIIFTILSLLGLFKIFSSVSLVTTTSLILLVCYFLAITGPIIGVKYRLPMEPILLLFVVNFLTRFRLLKFSKSSQSKN
jgi:4-amino-4-deoxy-L-arabinose transferase-like glycosyltransferase